MEDNKELKEAKEKLDKITEDARMQQLAWWREKAIYEENTMLNSSFRKGKKDGKTVTTGYKFKLVISGLQQETSNGNYRDYRNRRLFFCYK